MLRITIALLLAALLATALAPRSSAAEETDPVVVCVTRYEFADDTARLSFISTNAEVLFRNWKRSATSNALFIIWERRDVELLLIPDSNTLLSIDNRINECGGDEVSPELALEAGTARPAPALRGWHDVMDEWTQNRLDTTGPTTPFRCIVTMRTGRDYSFDDGRGLGDGFLYSGLRNAHTFLGGYDVVAFAADDPCPNVLAAVRALSLDFVRNHHLRRPAICRRHTLASCAPEVTLGPPIP
jgi:hypothetical protein